jgi:hypothetical protein
LPVPEIEALVSINRAAKAPSIASSVAYAPEIV